MARETKAQRLVREQADRMAQEATLMAAYLPRLMSALERATSVEGFELMVKDSQFFVRDFSKVNLLDQLAMSPTFSWDSFYQLEELERTMDQMAAQRQAELDLREVRRAAFLKLTVEERNALGLNSEFNW